MKALFDIGVIALIFATCAATYVLFPSADTFSQHLAQSVRRWSQSRLRG